MQADPGDLTARGGTPEGGPDTPVALEKALRNAGIYLRRGDLESAERECQAAAVLGPDDAAVHELLGDILLAKGDRPAARESYKRAVELAPQASSPEMKYARLVLNLGEEAWETERRQALLGRTVGPKVSSPRSSVIAFLASSLWPGLGQWYNGETTKAIILAGVYGFVMLVLLATGDLGRLTTWFFAGLAPGRADLRGAQVSPFAAILWGGAAMAWLYAVIDAPLKASRQAKEPPDPYTEPNF